jgi:hypothetical protein
VLKNELVVKENLRLSVQRQLDEVNEEINLSRRDKIDK